MNTMFGLPVWARVPAGTNEHAAAKAKMSAMRVLMIACIVILPLSDAS
jgi:hypothetical protein